MHRRTNRRMVVDPQVVENVGRDSVRHCIYVQNVLRTWCKPTTHSGTRYACFSLKLCCQESRPWSDQLACSCKELLSKLSASTCSFLCLMQLVLLCKPPHVARSFCIICPSSSPLNFCTSLVFHAHPALLPNLQMLASPCSTFLVSSTHILYVICAINTCKFPSTNHMDDPWWN